jgi:putative phosphoribosyl transferase
LIIDQITGKFQLKIKDRESAGNILGNALTGIVKKEDRNSTLVVGIPRGGLVIAEIIARKLKCEFDLLMVKRLRSPHNDELAIGAVAEDGTTYLNELIIKELQISPDYIEKEKSYQLEEIKCMTKLFNIGNKSSLKNANDLRNDLKNKSIIVVDDGSATGSTLIAAVRYMRKNMMPKRLIIALPISPKGTINKLKSEDINHIEVITSPQDNSFVSIEQYYRNFDQITDRQVFDIMERNLK